MWSTVPFFSLISAEWLLEQFITKVLWCSAKYTPFTKCLCPSRLQKDQGVNCLYQKDSDYLQWITWHNIWVTSPQPWLTIQVQKITYQFQMPNSLTWHQSVSNQIKPEIGSGLVEIGQDFFWVQVPNPHSGCRNTKIYINIDEMTALYLDERSNEISCWGH